MATARDWHAVGSDDMGSVAVADIEDLPLHLLAEVPPEDPVVGADILLGLEPAQALALCESSPFYQEVCDRSEFKRRYLFKWHTTVYLRGPHGLRIWHLLKLRTIGDVKGLYEQEFGVARTDYMLVKPTVRLASGYFAHVVPTAQSTVGGVPRSGPGIELDILPGAPRDATLTHWFANGESIELSE